MTDVTKAADRYIGQRADEDEDSQPEQRTPGAPPFSLGYTAKEVITGSCGGSVNVGGL